MAQEFLGHNGEATPIGSTVNHAIQLPCGDPYGLGVNNTQEYLDENRKDIKKNSEEIANQKVSQEFSFTKTITAGTIGTRDSALTLNVGKSGYVPRSYEIIEIDGSSNASVQVVRNGSDKNTAAILFYRATSSGGNMSGKIRVEYDKA